ncbi:hypothetical protein PCE1_003157 [Barthelona sp. PCE]
MSLEKLENLCTDMYSGGETANESQLELFELSASIEHIDAWVEVVVNSSVPQCITFSFVAIQNIVQTHFANVSDEQILNLRVILLEFLTNRALEFELDIIKSAVNLFALLTKFTWATVIHFQSNDLITNFTEEISYFVTSIREMEEEDDDDMLSAIYCLFLLMLDSITKTFSGSTDCISASLNRMLNQRFNDHIIQSFFELAKDFLYKLENTDILPYILDVLTSCLEYDFQFRRASSTSAMYDNNRCLSLDESWNILILNVDDRYSCELPEFLCQLFCQEFDLSYKEGNNLRKKIIKLLIPICNLGKKSTTYPNTQAMYGGSNVFLSESLKFIMEIYNHDSILESESLMFVASKLSQKIFQRSCDELASDSFNEFFDSLANGFLLGVVKSKNFNAMNSVFEGLSHILGVSTPAVQSFFDNSFEHWINLVTAFLETYDTYNWLENDLEGFVDCTKKLAKCMKRFYNRFKDILEEFWFYRGEFDVTSEDDVAHYSLCILLISSIIENVCSSYHATSDKPNNVHFFALMYNKVVVLRNDIEPCEMLPQLDFSIISLWSMVRNKFLHANERKTLIDKSNVFESELDYASAPAFYLFNLLKFYDAEHIVIIEYALRVLDDWCSAAVFSVLNDSELIPDLLSLHSANGEAFPIIADPDYYHIRPTLYCMISRVMQALNMTDIVYRFLFIFGDRIESISSASEVIQISLDLTGVLQSFLPDRGNTGKKVFIMFVRFMEQCYDAFIQFTQEFVCEESKSCVDVAVSILDWLKGMSHNKMSRLTMLPESCRVSLFKFSITVISIIIDTCPFIQNIDSYGADDENFIEGTIPILTAIQYLLKNIFSAQLVSCGLFESFNDDCLDIFLGKLLEMYSVIDIGIFMEYPEFTASLVDMFGTMFKQADPGSNTTVIIKTVPQLALLALEWSRGFFVQVQNQNLIADIAVYVHHMAQNLWKNYYSYIHEEEDVRNFMIATSFNMNFNKVNELNFDEIRVAMTDLFLLLCFITIYELDNAKYTLFQPISSLLLCMCKCETVETEDDGVFSKPTVEVDFYSTFFERYEKNLPDFDQVFADPTKDLVNCSSTTKHVIITFKKTLAAETNENKVF